MADNLPDVYLRFKEADPDIRGESMDAAYSKDDNWLSIKSFNFGFGWGGSGSDSGSNDSLREQLAGEEDPEKRRNLQRRINELERKHSRTPDSNGSSSHHGGGSGHGSGQSEGQLQPKEFNFARTPGPASKDILLNLQNGNDDLAAELIVCRAAGVDIPHGEAKDAKIPFLRFVFEDIKFTKCALTVSKDQPPSETVEFWFDKVKMETIWTDNETGAKVPGGKNTVSFDFSDTKKDPVFNSNDDD